ncbi:YfhL family 4Fe-4S dicluster ferredoxin [Acinetobacter junii]|uniref:YfhL family 4Fe-4S dicluster ferredoxin n=1 Tax=Acinetobacter junii TaxID=40215 RepID=A0AAX1MMK5_ACIJU|nr:YfhL family 4Fe-4S dicluster ferredoxin [Acinetobacter junii]QUY37867.1 YfhL family 4Fe-4S dicluster ferredoxin [Acinetobacter junii]RSE30800.1 YfhL family 4Fe-4S dicluster ferredoxin [Acinetobacter junii]USR74629.1 YfhL family 4Fe-4S dicluster ferredoxin [Acinetobacter junii]
MALMITTACINCDMCLPECPNEAIYEGAKIYEIDTERCTECVGFYDAPTCIAVCPIDCVKPDPKHNESNSELLEKFRRLKSQ